MYLTGWGRYPKIKSEVLFPCEINDVLNEISCQSSNELIARGLGRSYGDSSLAPNVISSKYLNHFINFDIESGILTCAAGVNLLDILSVFVPQGWFLPVSPGTKFITIGGAIASDIHGKNHHIDGCFSEFILSLKIATITNGIIECSKEQHPELFHATCGGMGLTGFILEATFKLIPIRSAHINKTTIKTSSLKETLELFELHKEAHYSVAWIDCLSTGRSFGRSILMLGKHSNSGSLTTQIKRKSSVNIDMPNFLLNKYSTKIFNNLYYHSTRKTNSTSLTHFEPFFYPLDTIHQWNKIYGKRGFTQYQLVLPKEAGVEGMTTILKRITDSKRGSFLSVLKKFGKENNNYLSFPMDGYTLALDFKLEKGLFEFLDELDRIVLEYGGRLYLTKDVRMSEKVFKKSYPHWGKFLDVRKKYGANQVFNSLQSQRLGL